MISLPFSFQCQTILLGKNSNRPIVSMIHIGSVLISRRTRLTQTPGFQQRCSEEMGSWMHVPARAALRFCFPFVLPFLGVFLAILWQLMDVAGQLGVLVPGSGCCATCPQPAAASVPLGWAFPKHSGLISAGAAVAALKFLSNLIQCLLVIDRL